jgi:hypothetical protein
MSVSQTPSTNVVAAICVAVLLLSGCGSSDSPEGPKSVSQPDLSGKLQPTEEVPSATEPAPAPPSAEPKTAPEATDFAPVDIELSDGGFARGTPRAFHLPAGFIIVVRVRADRYGPYKLRVRSPSTAQSITIRPGGTTRITLDSLKSGAVAELMLAEKTVRLAADAEPGP